MTTKTCTKCDETKPLDEFPQHRYECVVCYRGSQKARAQAALVKKYSGQSSRCDGRACTVCNEFKPWTGFEKSRRGRNGRSSKCASCIRKRRAVYNPTRCPKKRSDQRLVRKYGITREQFQGLVEDQGGCAICGLRCFRLVVDHNHKTGEVRGALCSTCNKGIGLLQDSPSIVRAALDYLENRGHYSPHPED
jgi:hypothetical protein